MGVKAGEQGLKRYVAAKRLARVRARIQRSGAVALAVLDLIPPPFPFTPFVLAAGALGVNASTFFVTLVVCRLLRFGLEAALAVIYGPHILSWLESDLFHDIVIGCVLVAVVLIGPLGHRAGQNIRPPKGTSRSGVSSTTAPSASGTPSVSTSDMNGPICLGGKLTTATTSRWSEIALDVVFRDLGRRFPDAEVRAEIDAQPIRGLPRLGKVLNVDNPPDPDVDAFELGVGKGCRFASHCAET